MNRQIGTRHATPLSIMERLTSADFKSFRALLVAERMRILDAFSANLDALEIADNISAEDQATLLHDQAVALHCRSQESKKLRKIGAAFERLRKGIFGVCQTCEEPISRKRLFAIPWADHCVPCQEQLHSREAEAAA